MDCKRLEVGDHVTQVNTNNPVGIIEEIHSGMDVDICLVRWGTGDGRTFRDSFRMDELQKVEERIYSPDEVIQRQTEAAGGKLIED